MPEPNADVVYYGVLTPGRSRANPAGIVRRSVVDGHPCDEAFTRSQRWGPTTSLLEEQLGGADFEHVEITESEALAFVDRITARQRG